jgi:hypothetical protein
MANAKSPKGADPPVGEAAVGENRWSKRYRDSIQIAFRLARLADYLAKVWHDWTGGPGRPTRW